MPLVGKENDMATKKESIEPRTTPVKIETGLVKKARIVASDKGITLSAYLGGSLRTTVGRDWSNIVRKMASEDDSN